MSTTPLALAWLVGSLMMLVFSVNRLPPLRDRALQLTDANHRRRKLEFLDRMSAAVVASTIASFAYLMVRFLVPAFVGWRAVLVGALILLPFYALAAMLAFVRLMPGRGGPSWRLYGGCMWRCGAMLAVLVVLPVALAEITMHEWLYPLLLYIAAFVIMLQAYRKATNAKVPPAGNGITFEA